MEATASTRITQSHELIDRIVSGDEGAFADLVEEHHEDLLRVSYVILGDIDAAEEATQIAWTKAWSRVQQLRDRDRARSWLIAIAANEARQLYRRERLRRFWTPVAEYGLQADPVLADLAAVLSGLSIDDRRLLSMRYAGHLRSVEIGEILGISAGAVRHRLMRLIQRLRMELQT